jgi:hypothetical protein
VGGLYFATFLFEALHKISASLSFQFAFHLGEAFLDCFGLEVFACLLTGLLVGEEDLPVWGNAYMA